MIPNDPLKRLKAPIFTWEYRLVRGTSWEGISIREIYYDEYGKIKNWTRQPLVMLTNDIEEIKSELLSSMKDLDDMLNATTKPILDEAEMEFS